MLLVRLVLIAIKSMLSEFKILVWPQRDIIYIIFFFLSIKLIDLTLKTQEHPTPSLREENSFEVW